MFSLFNKKNKEAEITSKDGEVRNVVILPEREDEATGVDNKPLLEAMAETSDVPIFKGEVENAYESDFLGYKDKCPLCHTPTQQMYSNYVWTNQVASRLMAAPAGHFCPNCPTVIIDDDIMQGGINKSRFLYWGTVAIDTGVSDKQDSVNLFQTFNGIKPTYILDKNGGILNSVHQPSGQTFAEGSPGSLASLQNNAKKANYASNLDTVSNSNNTIKEKIQKAKSKKKNKQAKQSRKANRKK
jgi:hypothetical protein